MNRNEELFPMRCPSCSGQSGITFCANCNSTGVVLAKSIETQLEERMPPLAVRRLQARRNWRAYVAALNNVGVSAGQAAENIRNAVKGLRQG